jgi:hypothetical protein
MWRIKRLTAHRAAASRPRSRPRSPRCAPPVAVAAARSGSAGAQPTLNRRSTDAQPAPNRLSSVTRLDQCPSSARPPAPSRLATGSQLARSWREAGAQLARHRPPPRPRRAAAPPSGAAVPSPCRPPAAAPPAAAARSAARTPPCKPVCTTLREGAITSSDHTMPPSHNHAITSRHHAITPSRHHAITSHLERGADEGDGEGGRRGLDVPGRGVVGLVGDDDGGEPSQSSHGMWCVAWRTPMLWGAAGTPGGR